MSDNVVVFEHYVLNVLRSIL